MVSASNGGVVGLLGAAAFPSLAPRISDNTHQWCAANIRTHEDEVYSDEFYPHLALPDGPFDAFDDPTIRIIWLMFGSRLGKTFFGQCCQISTAANNASPMMFVSSTEKLASEVVKRTYDMLQNCWPTRHKVPPKGKRNRTLINLGDSRIHVGWARSVTTLADKAVKFGHGNEIDKWEYVSTSKEGDPLNLFLERGKEYADRKFILEGTPTIARQSRIEAGYLRSDRRKLFVPCPRCGDFQVLELGNGETHGLKWDKLNGRSDPDVTQETARYICIHCKGEIEEHQRRPMIRDGRWVREGQEIDRGGNVTGAPIRRGHEAGFHLSSIYALKLTFGEYAAEFVRSKGKGPTLRNYVNGWEAKTWEPFKQQSKPEQVGQRLNGGHARGIVPVWATYLTIGADKQREDGGFVPFVVLAHGPENRCAVIDYGTRLNLDTLYETIITRKYEHADGRWAIASSYTLADSGDDTDAVYTFMAAHKGECILPCKGRDSAGGDEAFLVATLGEHGEKGLREAGKKHIGQVVIHVNTDFTEESLQHLLEDSVPGEPNSLSLCIEASRDMDFLEQLCNGAKQEKLNKRNVLKSLWMKMDENQPNDFRDAVRYGRTAARCLIVSRHGVEPLRQAPPAPRPVEPQGNRFERKNWIRRRA